MKQNVYVTLTVEFDDKHAQKDVDEARMAAIADLNKVLMFIPTLKGKSSTGKVVEFKVREFKST